jgi:hypothetical protein
MNTTKIKEEISSCNCIVYHPTGEQARVVFDQWRADGSPHDIRLAQLFGNCPAKEA